MLSTNISVWHRLRVHQWSLRDYNEMGTEMSDWRGKRKENPGKEGGGKGKTRKTPRKPTVKDSQALQTSASFENRDLTLRSLIVYHLSSAEKPSKPLCAYFWRVPHKELGAGPSWGMPEKGDGASGVMVLKAFQWDSTWRCKTVIPWPWPLQT